MKLVINLERLEAIDSKKAFPAGKLYHLSKIPLTSILTPRIPKNFLTTRGYEDNTTKRVVAATSIDGCLRGLSANLKHMTFFVYELHTKSQVRTPTIKEVPDSGITGEKWILGDAKPQLLGSIRVGEALDRSYTYTYGDGQTAELYDWEWFVVEIA